MRAGWVVAVSFTLVGCALDTRVPPATVIACDAERVCPSGYSCSALVGRCLPTSGDTTAPGVAQWQVLHQRLKRGDLLEVTLTATEPLFIPPRVTLIEGPFSVEMPAEPSAADALTFTFRRVISADDEEGAATLFADLVDLNGLQPPPQRCPVPVTLDFTAPSVLSSSASVRLVPPAGSPLESVSAAGLGTTVELSFVSSEALAAPPTVVATPSALPFTVRAGSGTSFVVEHHLDTADASQGPHRFRVSLQDDVGNAATVELEQPQFTIDTVAPAAPDVETPARVLFRREPWGTAANPAAFSVLGDAGAVEPASLVRILSTSQPSSGTLGETRASDDGRFEVPLTSADRTVVYVSAVDVAGNQSAVVAVRDVEWRATLAGKVRGSSVENPHGYEVTTEFTRARLDPAEAQPDASVAESVSLADGITVSTAGAPSWQLRSVDSPPKLSLSPLAYDRNRDRVVLFGGQRADGSSSNETWEWDGVGWTNRTPTSGSPDPRFHHALGYDAARARVVLFGGRTRGGTTFSNETWEWDGIRWTKRASAVSPPALAGASMAYDDANARLLMWGGFPLVPAITWTWDGDTWQALAADAGPEPRRNFGFAYDTARSRLVMYGGLYEDGGRASDAWEFDGTTWVDRTDAGTPGARTNIAMAFNSTAGVIDCYGGAPFGSQHWQWDGSGPWTPFSGPRPPARESHGMTAAGARGTVVFSGVSVDAGADTWVLKGSSWSNVTPDGVVPPPRYASSLAYDSARHEAVTFNRWPADTDTWVWDGARWAQRDAGASVPPVRQAYGLVFDTARAKTVLFGGRNTAPYGDLWEWDGAQWVSSLATGPSARSAMAMAYDTARHVTVMFGGLTASGLVNDTWEWDGASWLNRAPASSPGARGGAQAAFDERRNRVVMFGASLNQDTWEWNGVSGTWSKPSLPGPLPASRTGAMLAYDNARRVVVLFGGVRTTSADPLGDTWEYDGTRWADRTPTTPGPSPRQRSGFAFDAQRQALMLFGGIEAETTNELWERINHPTSRPAHLVHFDFSAAHAEPGSVIESLSTAWVAAGDGTSPTPTTGVALWGFDKGTFTQLATNDAPTGQARSVSWSTNDSAQLERMLRGGQLTSFAITPRAGNGTGASVVEADFVELVVRYRRP